MSHIVSDYFSVFWPVGKGFWNSSNGLAPCMVIWGFLSVIAMVGTGAQWIDQTPGKYKQRDARIFVAITFIGITGVVMWPVWIALALLSAFGWALRDALGLPKWSERHIRRAQKQQDRLRARTEAIQRMEREAGL